MTGANSTLIDSWILNGDGNGHENVLKINMRVKITMMMTMAMMRQPI